MQPLLTSIPVGEVLHYLGIHTPRVPEELGRQIALASQTVLDAGRPRVLHRRFFLEGTHLSGTGLTLAGVDIARHLDGCREAVLMAATLGPEVETLLLRAQVTDLSQALVLDACASAAIEAVCDALEGQLQLDTRNQGLSLTGRYSPGYGDFPLSQQRAFCDTLDTARRIGLTVSRSGILLPRKSVTAVLGLCSSPRPRRGRDCGQCRLSSTCPYRKDGKHCGN